MIDSITHEDFHKVDKYASLNFCVARVHLGTFNPESQPFFNEDKSLCIFMDGKIYGYEEEMDKLRNKHEINVDNDPEFCLHLYEEYGVDFVKHLNGSFVIVIYHINSNKIVIVNDRYGLRPFYYTMDSEKLLFASETKAILKDPSFEKTINKEALADFFAFGETFGNKTFLMGIMVLPPASCFIYDGGNVSIEEYWDFIYEPDYSRSENDFVDELVKTFKKAVKIRMKDEVSYAVSLSGGLDSRVVVGAIEKSKHRNVITYTFGPHDCDEVLIAKKVSDVLKTKFKIIEIRPEMLVDHAKNEVWLSDGRDHIGVSYIDPATKAIRDCVDVIFDGFALDLLLGGSYLTSNRMNYKNDEQLFSNLFKPRLFSEDELSKLIIPELYYKIKDIPMKSFKDEFSKIQDTHPGNKSDHFYLRTHVTYIPIGHNLVRNSVEISCPTFDNEFIDTILKIPPEMRLNHKIFKMFLIKLSPELAGIPYNETMVRPTMPLAFWQIGKLYQHMKDSMKRRIYILSNGKIYFKNNRSYVNFNEWFMANEYWNDFFNDLLFNKNSKISKYFNMEYIDTLLQEAKMGHGNNSGKILHLATFEIFLRQNEL